MNEIFQPYLRRFVIVFFNDILIYSKTLDEHLLHLRTIFDCLLTNQFFLKKTKSTFAQVAIEYLGHIVSRNGVEADPEKLKVMTAWPVPVNIKQL